MLNSEYTLATAEEREQFGNKPLVSGEASWLANNLVFTIECADFQPLTSKNAPKDDNGKPLRYPGFKVRHGENQADFLFLSSLLGKNGHPLFNDPTKQIFPTGDAIKWAQEKKKDALAKGYSFLQFLDEIAKELKDRPIRVQREFYTGYGYNQKPASKSVANLYFVEK